MMTTAFLNPFPHTEKQRKSLNKIFVFFLRVSCNIDIHDIILNAVCRGLVLLKYYRYGIKIRLLN